ncbi:MAG TPA: TonB-dependent receptor [Gemmatimonadales bacterium]|nr:TonB-dependent receptor [Gemmatimonadales bacterium]
MIGPRIGLLVGLGVTLGAASLAAQASGAIGGRVRDAGTTQPIANAQITVDEGGRGAVTSADGRFRVRVIRSGFHTVRVRAIGYRPVRLDSVLVRGGETTTLDLLLTAMAIEVEELVVQARPDPVLDPLATSAEQKVTAANLRELPVTTLEEGIALSAGTVGESYRGGRLGQQSYIVDGVGVKNQLDASSGPLGVRIPPDILTEASLVTNGFSARYGQALSGMINVVTRDGGERWSGRVLYETDRPLWQSWDLGLDRTVVTASGPLGGGVRVLGAIDISGRLDADPVNAPRPADPRDPRYERPWMLPHNSGEQIDAVAKVTVPVGGQTTLRFFGLHSEDQRLLYDPLYKYDVELSPGRRTVGNLLTGHFQHASGASAKLPFVVDLRTSFYNRTFVRGTLQDSVDYRFGAITGQRLHFVGEDIARAQDTVSAMAPIPGLLPPDLSDRTPWGVSAFFLGQGSRGEIAWNRFREFRSQLDLTLGVGATTDILAGGELVTQRVQTFQRVQGYEPVGGAVPPATASDFSPLIGAAYAEGQVRVADVAFTGGVRYDLFDPGAKLPGQNVGARQRLSPRAAVSTVLAGATVVASYGLFSQPPDFQFLVDAAFDDTTRTGRFRRGNPNLGFEKATQFELSLRARPREHLSLRLNAFVKRLEGLVASVPLGVSADSSVFGNTDVGTVKGGEIILEREPYDGFGARVTYTLQQATATSTSAFLLRQAAVIDPTSGDTVFPARVEFPLDFDRRHGLTIILQGKIPETVGPVVAGVRPLAGLESAVIVRYGSGLPFSRTNAAGDSLVGLPNDSRLPSQSTIDLLVRRSIRVGGTQGSLYLDMRNLFNRRNLVAVRRDTGEPELDEQSIKDLAEAAYQEHPEAIPYESPRYRAQADLDGNGLIEGQDELLPLFEAAARDFTQPLFVYGPPRLVRLGIEIAF